jgi:hypothetical protein
MSRTAGNLLARERASSRSAGPATDVLVRDRFVVDHGSAKYTTVA